MSASGMTGVIVGHTMTPEEIIAGLGAAEGPDRELDLAIGLAVDGWTLTPDDLGGMVEANGNIFSAQPGGSYPSPTESLDEAVEFVGRALPGGFWQLDGRAGRCKFRAMVAESAVNPIRVGMGSTPAIALLIAALKAIPDRAQGPHP